MIGHLIQSRIHYGAPLNTTQTAIVFIEGDQAALIRAVLGGHVDGVIEHVTEVIEEEGTARDVTHDFSKALYWALEGQHPNRDVADFLEQEFGPGSVKAA